jgi:ABC-type dipeptide/oligopeptide/nickel transport system permease component
MIFFILRRTLQSILTVLGVITVSFFLVRLAGDPVALLLPIEASDQDVARLRDALGLDQSLVVQYLKFLWRVMSGDFGFSLRQHAPALSLVLERIPATLELALS